jgi:hypothetical protein
LSDVALRELHLGRVWRANACRLLADGEEEVALWSPRGTLRKLPVGDDGSEIRIPRPDWKLGERVTGEAALCLLYPKRRYSLGLFWRRERFSHWYVNLERPLGRSPVGWDYVDHKLDLIVLADGTVHWKDEDELAQAAAAGLLDEQAVRADAAHVLADPPWPTGWEDFRPEPGWSTPSLPEGWDRI